MKQTLPISPTAAPPLSVLVFVACAFASTARAADEIAPIIGTPPDEIPADATISNVFINPENIFDLTKEEEDKWLYRWMNRLHIITKPRTIENQLLFQEGDVFDSRVAEESERILRGNKYLYDADITPVLTPDGTVEVNVTTRDVWTLTPEITYSRDGGENKTVFGVEESNLLGTGQRVLLTRSDDVERTSTEFEYFDRQIGRSWVSLSLVLADNSDGHSNRLAVVKPFHALDARKAGSVILYDDDRRSTLYDLGDEAAEFRHQQQNLLASYGWSDGLRNNWVRRWTTGVVYDDNEFSAVQEPELPQVIPENRKLVYPFIGYEILEDDFRKASNHNQIDRSEDFYLGTRLGVTLGWSDEQFGADRDALVYALSGNLGFGSLEKHALLLGGRMHGREEQGESANAIIEINADYYWRQSEKRLFFMHADTTIGHNLDIDNPVEIGGDSGLRGYPLRYQAGDSRFLFSIEQRYFTDWYPWRLFRVGGAVFADIGRVWGDSPIDAENLGWLRDVGFGLRLAPTRLGTSKVFHIDIAFPLDGDADIDSVQVLIEAKRGF